MKRIGDIMQEMGFNKEASEDVKEAFVRHLIKVATGTKVEPRNKKKTPEQLAFDFESDKKNPQKVG